MKNVRLVPFFLLSAQIVFSCRTDKPTISESMEFSNQTKFAEKKNQDTSLQYTKIKINSSQKRKNKSFSKVSIYNKLQSPVQKFELSSLKDTMLYASQGTKLDIKKNSFLLNGHPYVGSVSLHLKECYSYEDMIFNNLSTLSNGRLLESGGMICLEAFTNDHQKLTLDSHQPIGLQMPSETPKQYMQLFYADNNMNWLQASDSKPQFAAVNNNKKKRFSDIRSGNYFITANGYGTVITDISILKDGKERHLSSTSYANRSLYQSWRDSMTLHFEMDEHGTLYNTRINDTLFTRNHKMTAHRLESMNDASMTYYPYTPGNMRFTDCNLLLKGTVDGQGFPPSFSFIIPRNIYTKIKQDANHAGRSKVIVRNTYIFRSNRMGGKEHRIKEVQAKLDSSGGSVKDISVEDLQYYAFSINQLGWINCDRFYNVPVSQKINFTIANEGNTDLKLVFTDMKSVLTGCRVKDKIVFSNVPKNKSVTLVGIRIVNDKTELAMLKTTTQEFCETPLNYQPVSIEELKTKIKTML
jgi:hypothetical protein